MINTAIASQGRVAEWRCVESHNVPQKNTLTLPRNAPSLFKLYDKYYCKLLQVDYNMYRIEMIEVPFNTQKLEMCFSPTCDVSLLQIAWTDDLYIGLISPNALARVAVLCSVKHFSIVALQTIWLPLAQPTLIAPTLEH